MRKFGTPARGFVVVGALSFGLALSLAASHAVAKDAAADSKAKKKVLVGGFAGPKSASARKAVIAALKDDGAYDVGETSEAKPGGDNKSFAKASNGASAVLVGTVKKSGLVLSVRNGADGALVQDVEVKGDSPAKLSKNIADSLGLSVADPLAQTKAGEASVDAAKPSADAAKPSADAAPADEEEKESEPAEAPVEDAEASAGPSTPGGLSKFEIMAGLRAIHRSFTYHDTPAQLFPARNFPEPLTYSLPLGPAVFIDGTIYPGAFATQGPGAWLGITGSYERNFATSTVFNEGKLTEGKLTTEANQYFIGLKGRIPVSVHEFGLVGGVGKHTFNLRGDENAPLVPDVWYTFVKLGLEGRFNFAPFSVGFHGGTRLVSNTGGLARDWFPGHVRTQSLELGINGGYTIIPSLDVVAGFDLMRYAFDFNPFPSNADPNTNLIAGGGVDQYSSGWLGLRYSLR